MLQKKKSKAIWQFKYVLLLPLVLGMLVYTSCQTNSSEDTNSKEESLEERLVKLNNEIEGKDSLTMNERNEIAKMAQTMVDGMNKSAKIVDGWSVKAGINTSGGSGVPFTVVDEVPIFPGCEDAADKKACFHEKIQAHIRKNFRYPEAAQEQGIQGRVSSIFTIDKEGNVVDIKMRGPDELLENETGRILAKLPKMEPGKQNGQAVNVPFSIPITFKLDDDGDQTKKSVQESSDSYPFATIDEVPVFPGCENAVDPKECFAEKLVEHIKKNFRYPEAAQEQGIQGRVSVVFTIDVNGNVSSIKKRGPHELLENEAVRIIGLLPQMQPGKHEGKVMNVPYAIPITFRLKNQPEGTTVNRSKDYLLVDGMKVKKQGKTYFEGVVTDKESMGLSGVVVSIEGKEAGVMSNFNGAFSIAVEEDDVVKFQYEGLPDKRLEVSQY